MPRGGATKNTKATKAVKQLDSDFLSAGTTHVREKLTKVTALENDYTALLNDADVLASFIESGIPYAEGIPHGVTEAYKNIKHRKLTHF